MKYGTLVCGVVFCALLAGAAGAWEEPADWSRIGAVQTWMDYDQVFYRAYDDKSFLDRSQFKLDQVSLYDRTRVYNEDLPATSVEQFLALSEADRAERTKLAKRKLAYATRFLDRVRDGVMKTRSSQPSDYGKQVSDSAVIGDMLDRLGDAVGLDPSNPYVWHLLAYFAACAGDVERAHAALGGAVEALNYVPAEAMPEMKRRVALDRAWLLRDVGLFDEALADLDLAEQYGPRDLEVLLMRGLIAAQTGDAQAAGRVASELRKTEVRKFPADFTTASFSPEIVDTASWKKQPSTYLQAWITALSLLNQGQMEAARAAFGDYNPDDLYPFGWRFWNDAGFIYEVTGRPDKARLAWNTARINRHYVQYLIYKPYGLNLAVLTGTDMPASYFLGYDQYYLGGSRLSYGASLVGKTANAEDLGQKHEWAMRALDQLDYCINTGVYPGQAAVLRGQVFYLLGDAQSAMMELQAAVPHLQRQGFSDQAVRVQQDIQALAANQKPRDGSVMLTQSGSSQGRWDPEHDAEATQAELVAAFQANPDDDLARFDLARFLIRQGQAVEGRDLVAAQYAAYEAGGGDPPQEAVGLMLEADRVLGQPDLALKLVEDLDNDRGHLWSDPGLWALTGFICQDQGHAGAAKRAMAHAADLDPSNLGVQMQLLQMED